MEKREKIAQYAYMYDGDWAIICNAVTNNIEADNIEIRENYITVFDEEYPECLKQLRYSPWILFYQGDISLLKSRCMTMIGSRSMTAYGERMTKMCADLLKREYTLVSGLAKGVDGMVHRCAADGGRTIGVIGSGFSVRYPSCNQDLYEVMAKEHLILSEYPWHTGISRHHFPWRNRILAALGEAVFVMQAEIRSGTMLTVNEALQLSREVYAVPYPFGSEEGAGCNKLIYDGANILYTREQITDFLSQDICSHTEGKDKRQTGRMNIVERLK